MVVREVILTAEFEGEVKKLDGTTKNKVKKQIKKLVENPELGKPLKWSLKGNRVVRVPPYRLIYSFSKSTLVLLRLAHRKNVYKG